MKRFLCLLIILASSQVVIGRILMKPYLQAVTSNSIYIIVECTTPDTVTVNFGLTQSYGHAARTEIIATTTASPVTYVHKVKLTGLTADTKYFYEAIQGNSTFRSFSFHTAPNPGKSFRFTWMADCRTGKSVHDRISQLMLEANPLFSLYGGDLCASSSYPAWKNEFFRTKELDLISVVPFFNTTGNHEGIGQNTYAFMQNPSSASNTQDYYSFDYGDIHFLCINTELSCSEDSPQYKFAEQDLASSKQPWKIVYSHIPGYGSGGHGEDKELINMIKKIFEPHHVDLLISGHSHYYQHNLVNGIHHLIIGSAGAPLYTPLNATYTVKSLKDYNFAVFNVTTDSLTINVYNDKNVKLDSLKLTKNMGK